MVAATFVAAGAIIITVVYLRFGNSLSSLLSWIFQRVIVVGLHRIKIDGLVIYSADSDSLRECLEKQCTGLTSNRHHDLTAEESLVLSLFQHYSSRYWLNSLDYASLSVIKGLDWLDESTWNKFRATIVCHESSGSITAKQVGELLRRFHHFWAQHHPKNSDNQIICFDFLNEFRNLSLSSKNSLASSTHPSSTYYLWYDKKRKCFEAITCLSNFYQDTASYWECLMLRAESCFDQYFKREFNGLFDEKLELRFIELNDEIKSIGNTFDFFKRQFEKWKVDDELHHIVLDMESCIQSPDEDSKDSAPAWCEQLWHVTARCLARQIEQAYIDQKREIEMKRRKTNSEIDKIQENIERLNWEIAKARQRINTIDRRAANEDKLLERLAWNQLLLDLANPGFVPDYSLACQRQNHEIYKEKNASLLAVKVFDLLHPSSTKTNKERRAIIEKYVKNQSTNEEILKELHSALDNYVGREISHDMTRKEMLTIHGEASVVLQKIISSVKFGEFRQVVIKAERVIYVDCDWEVPGINVTLSAPLIHIICSPGDRKRTITTSGRDGIEHEHLKAADGNGAGASGSHGLVGEDGEDAGNVKIDCQNFIGLLKIVARGGNGADGQHGGDGQPGLKGYDGHDGTFPDEPVEGHSSYFLVILRSIKLLYESKGWPGKPGGNGGSGGNGGKGGRGGHGGKVNLLSSHLRLADYSRFVERDCADGKNGEDGQPGHGSPGGSGGKHGQDATQYFEPINESWPILWLTGHWRRIKGSITLEEIRFMEVNDSIYKIIGYKISKNNWPNMRRRAVDGQRGTEGKKAVDYLLQRSTNATGHETVVETVSQFQNHHNTRSDEYEREGDRQSKARRRDEKQQINETKFIHRMSKDIVEEWNAISRHEEALAVDRQQLERMDESRQLVHSKIQETFEQRIVLQSVVGQRITRQVKLDFDDDLGLAPSSIPTDLGLDIRFGLVPVSGKLTTGLHCLAEVDALTHKRNCDNRLKISKSVQSLVLKLSLDKHEKEWKAIEKIINQTNDPLKLADSLEFIASNLPLIIALADQSPAMEILQKFLASTVDGHHQEIAAEKDVICVLHELHQRPFITVQQVISLLRDISDWTQQSHILLSLLLEKWLLSTITKIICEVFGNDELGHSRVSLFAKVWMQCSLVSKFTKSAVLSSDAADVWFNHVEHFVIQLEVLRHEKMNAVDELLLSFARDRLGIARNVSKTKNEKKWQLVLVLQHLNPTFDEVVAIGQRARKNFDRQLMELVERSFNEKFVTPIWSEMQPIIQSCNWDPKSGQNHGDIEKAIHKFKTASISSFTSLSFEERLQLGLTLKEKLCAGPDSEEHSIHDWIKHESEKIEASTAELFVKNKSEAHDDGQIILSLLADTKKKTNVMLELHYRLRHLSPSFKPNQIVELTEHLRKKSSNRSSANDFNSYHWHCFHSRFMENWINYFFSHWSHCYQQTEHLRDVIAGKNPDDDDRTLNTLELALERFLLFTTGLPPLEAVEKWRRLEQQSLPQDRMKLITEHLKQAIEEIESEITPTINQLYSNKLLAVNDEHNSKNYFGKDIVDLMDFLFEIILETTVSFFDDAGSVRSLLDVIEATQMMMDLMNDDLALDTSNPVISSAKLGEWKKKLAQWKVNNCEAASMVYLAVKELVKAAEYQSSNEDNCSKKIYDRIIARRQQIFRTFNEALSWLETFVGYLADPRSGLDILKVVKMTIISSQFLSWKALKNEKSSLLKVAVDILTGCTSITKPVEISWSSFFGAVLNLESNEKAMWLTMKLASFVGGQLRNDRKRATWYEANRWFNRFQSLINGTVNGHRPDKENHWEEMMEIQQVLIDYCCACYESKLLADHERRSKNKLDLNLVWFTFKNVVDRWTNIVRFVRSNKKTARNQDGNRSEFLKGQIENRQFVLKGLIQLGQSDSLYWDEETVNRLFTDVLIPELQPSPDKMYILSQMVSGTRKAFLERWVSLESCWKLERIRVLEAALQEKTCSVNDAQLFFSISKYDIFTDEEKSYIDLIDDEPALKSSLLVEYGQHPSCFLSALQKLAIDRIRTEFVQCFKPSITDRDIERYLLKPTKNNAQYSHETLPDKQHIIQLCRSFHRLIRRKKEEGEEVRDWLLWIRDVVIPSLKSYEPDKGLSVHQITKFFEEVGGFPLNLCQSVTTSCRPHQWIDMLAVFAIENLLDQLNEKCREDEGAIKSSHIVQQLMRWWPSSGVPASFLHIFYRKIRQEMAGNPLQLMKLIQEVTKQMTALKLQSLKYDDTILDRFSIAPLIDWPSVMRYAQLTVDWSPELALRLVTVLDVQFGHQRTDQLLCLLTHRYPEVIDKSSDHAHLRNILKNLTRYPWIKDQWIALIDESLLTKSMEVKESAWNSISNSYNIEREMKKSSQFDLSVDDILNIMRRDPESNKVIDSEMAQRIKRIRIECKRKSSIFRKFNIGDWTQKIKEQSSNLLEVDDFLAVACLVVHEKVGYVPRDVQLIAVATFVSSHSDQQAGRMPRRMGQISTGEGKTLISALIAIYHVLRYWNEDRHVNIITSSSVLAEANIAEIGWLFQAFGVSVSNNCDQMCSSDDNIRRERYNNDVIYGDLGSFMRDILLTRFFEDKDVTRNRNPGAIIVDEVDSMTLDKGENVLYMSHNIPEMYDLMRLFVEIWTLVNAPDVVRLAESSDIIEEIRQLIEPMIPTCVPNCLKKFAERHLSTWIKSAFRASYLLQPNDAYKVDDCDDGQGRRIVIMDKETGVEQVQTEWSDGLQQFLQLKHGLKWSPISLKAIFMSNIGYFSEFEGRMYGLTGTLGSTAECDLLRQVFGVDFFRVPRFRPRFCVQHEPIIAHNRQDWLDGLQQAIISMTSSNNNIQQRSVLVVCENIESADSIYDHLTKTKTDDQIKVVKYVSSFDEAFKKHQHQEIFPGQVIIATNLAGRGTDLKPSKELFDNGGLHLIIGFVPPNARVEAQAEGRTARCGQPGSFQFVIENVTDQNQANISRDPYGRMLQLKSDRDDDERLRLENIRREGLPKILLEEKLFQEFYEKCVLPLKEKSFDSVQLFATAVNLQYLQKHHKTITRNCLNNRWAMWLDENASLIEKAHRDPVLAARLNDSFDSLTMSVQSSDIESIVSSPSEWMMLARCLEESSGPSDASKCYQHVTSLEPMWCENALIDLAYLALADNAGYEKKMEAKFYLKRARKLIDDRIEMLVSLYQQVDQCLNRQLERGSALCHKRFEEQMTNQIRLWQIHTSEIDNLLGVSLKTALAAVLPTENDQHIDQVIELLENCSFMKTRRYSKKVDKNSFNWPPFVVHCREPLMELVQKKNSKLSDIEDVIGKAEQNLWKSLISVYIDEGQEFVGGKIIKADQYVDEIPDTIISKGYQRILPDWLKNHDGQVFSLVSSTLGIESSDELKNLEEWLEDRKLLQVAEKCFRHRILKPIPTMDQDPEVRLIKGVELSSCADVVGAWFSSPIYERNGDQYVLRPLFDERKNKLAKQFGDYLVDVAVVKDPAIKFPSVKSDRSPDQIKEDLDEIKNRINSLNELDQLALLFYSEEKKEKAKEKESSALEQKKTNMFTSAVTSFFFSFVKEIPAVANHFAEFNNTNEEEMALKEKRNKLSAALMQAVDIHLGQLKTLSHVKSSFCSLHTALPPPGDDELSPTDEVQQFNNQHLDRVLRVEEHVSRWNWRIGVIALIGVAQLVGAIAFPFFSGGLVGEGINDLMFAFQCLLTPGSFSWKSYLVDKAKSLAFTAVMMGLGAARLVKASGGSLKQAGKLMCRFNGTLKGWYQAGKHVLIQCANIIKSSFIGQAVSSFLTWLNKFVMEQVLERIKSFLFNNLKIFQPAFSQLKDLMKSLMTEIVKSGKSAGEASHAIKEVLDRAKDRLAAGDWFTELRTNSSSITSRMMRIFNDSSAGLSSLQNNYVGEYQSHAATGDTQGIAVSANAGTIEKAISMGKGIIDHGKKASEVLDKINMFVATCQTVTKLATHGSTYVGDLNAALQDELRALKMKNQKNQQQLTDESCGKISEKEKKRFDEFVDETEGQIQSFIMKDTLDTIQAAWLQPIIQLKIERTVNKIGSKLIQKYCPSLLPEGFEIPTDEKNSKNSADDEEIPSEDKWINQMGNGKPAGPVEMQNAVDACGYVLEINDDTGLYRKEIEGDNKFNYYPEGNPYSDKPVVKISFTQNDDGSKHVHLIMPDGTKHDYATDPSDPPERCFYDALSKTQNDPSVDHTINKLKEHAKGNDRVRFMSKLGVNRSYQHLQVGAYRTITVGKTKRKMDCMGRPVEIITTETERKKKRYSGSKKAKQRIKTNLGFQQGDTYGHLVSLNSGGVDEEWNIARMTLECNSSGYREHEKNFEMVRDKTQSSEVITRAIQIHYERTVDDLLHMSESERRNPQTRFEVSGYEHDFHTGTRDNPTNLYKSGYIPNWTGKQAGEYFAEDNDSRKLKRTDMHRGTANVPHVSGPVFEQLFRNSNK